MIGTLSFFAWFTTSSFLELVLFWSYGDAFIFIINDAPFSTCCNDGPSSIQISSQILIPIATSSYQKRLPGLFPLAKYLASSKTE